MSIAKRIISAFLIVALSLSYIIFDNAEVVRADDTVIYFLNEYGNFSERQPEEIANKYYEALSFKTDSGHWYEEEPSLVAPYAGGKLNEATHYSMTVMQNFFRWLVGVQEVPVSTHSEELQCGAVARNFQFSHGITRDKMPSDMSDDFFNIAANAQHNTLFVGVEPQDAVYGWVVEGFNTSSNTISTVGHRQMMISYENIAQEFGYAGNIAIGHVTDGKGKTELPCVPFPSAGYFPLEVVENKYTVWSIELNKEILKFNEEDDIRIRVNNNIGIDYTCSTSDGSLQYDMFGSIKFLSPLEKGYYFNEGKYEITIEGLIDIESGKPAIVKYETVFFNMIYYKPATLISVNIAFTNGLVGVLPNSLTDSERESFIDLFEDGVELYYSTGITQCVDFGGKWIYSNGHYEYSGGTIELPKIVTDTNNIIHSIYSMNIFDDTYAVNVLENDVVSFHPICKGKTYSLDIDNSDLYASSICQYYFIYKNGLIEYKGDYLGEIVFDSENITGVFCRYFNDDKSRYEFSEIKKVEVINSNKLDVGDFVERCYQVCLDRNSEQEGKTYWVDKLNNGDACGAQVGYGFVFSQEYSNKNKTDEQYITDLYRMYFDREPDADGYEYWLYNINNGYSREAVFAGFANSEEFYNLCCEYDVVAGYYVIGMDNDTQGALNSFVARLYNICMNRKPDQGGQMYWVSELVNKNISGIDILYFFLTSQEYNNLNLNCKYSILYLYKICFNRVPSEGELYLSIYYESQNEIYPYWKCQLTRDTFIRFACSEEFSNMCIEYGIDSFSSRTYQLLYED
ncbi:MAG: DUF4214 domain-containing protein [Clostridia bacterium]|nr:DUF4214 domain-containing protein [Clostridia bacterium]